MFKLLYIKSITYKDCFIRARKYVLAHYFL